MREEKERKLVARAEDMDDGEVWSKSFGRFGRYA